jgi:hypothetical protein
MKNETSCKAKTPHCLPLIPCLRTEDSNDEDIDLDSKIARIGSSETTITNRRRSFFSKAAISAAALAVCVSAMPSSVSAAITQESDWPLWPALPVAPYSKRKTIRYQIAPGVWAFDQLIGIYYVHVPIRMTVVTHATGLLVYAPVAPKRECLALLHDLIRQHGPIRDIVLPSVAVEHKVNAGPFARAFPDAHFYCVENQYSFPLNLPNSFLGLPSWAQPLPLSSQGDDSMWGGDLEHEVLTVKPGIGSMYQDVALLHKPSQTLLVLSLMRRH